jgi:hypothetical protein
VFNNVDKLAVWLRWANPDDGWHYGDFPEHLDVAMHLANLVDSGVFGEDAEDLEECCTDVLSSLCSDPRWKSEFAGRPVFVGVTSGEDPRDFLRTATLANSYRRVRQLWDEYWQVDEINGRIPIPSSNQA